MDKPMIVFIFLLNFIGCKNHPDYKPTDDISTVPVDSLFSYSQDSGIINITVHADTLKLISSNPELYYPYGHLSNSKDLLDQYRNIELEIEIQFPYGDTTMMADTIYILSLNGSYLKLFHDPDFEQMQIVSGKIMDGGIPLKSTLSLGMSKIDFLHTYFEKLPEGYEGFNVIAFESGLTGIWHYYNFCQDTLNNVTYISDYQFN